MKSAHQPFSLAVYGCLSPRFRSDSRASDLYYKSADWPLSVAAVSPVECLPDTHHPLLTTHSPLTTFRINTCKSVSKQRTLTTSRINTYKKTGEGGSPNWGCTTPSLALPLANQPFLSPLCFHIPTNCFSCNPFLFTLICVAPGVTPSRPSKPSDSQDFQVFRGSLKDFATFKLSDPRYNRRSWNFRVSRTLSISWDQCHLPLRHPPLRQRKCARPSNSPAASNPNSKSPGAASIRDSGAALRRSLAPRERRIFGTPAPFATVGSKAEFPNEPLSPRRYGMPLSWRCRSRCSLAYRTRILCCKVYSSPGRVRSTIFRCWKLLAQSPRLHPNPSCRSLRRSPASTRFTRASASLPIPCAPRIRVRRSSIPKRPSSRPSCFPTCPTSCSSSKSPDLPSRACKLAKQCSRNCTPKKSVPQRRPQLHPSTFPIWSSTSRT